MNRASLEELWRPYGHELTSDYVGLWELMMHVRREEPGLDEDAVRVTVLAMIAMALEQRAAQAGTHPRGREGLEHVWDGPTGQVVDRIRRDWIALGRDPKPGEVVWLQAPRGG
jgi:hypothetical protein